MGHGNIYQDDENVAWLMDHDYTVSNVVFKTPKPTHFSASSSTTGTTKNRYHGSFLQLIPKTVARQMLHRILAHLEQLQEEEEDDNGDDGEALSRSYSKNPHSFVSSTLYQVWNEKVSSIQEYQVTCQNVLSFDEDNDTNKYTWPNHSYCCQVRNVEDEVVAAIKHPQERIIRSTSSQQHFKPQDNNNNKMNINHNNHLDDVDSITTISVEQTGILPMESWQTPNFFDLLVQNDCVPTTKQCHKCLKARNSCADCLDDCGCYCQALC